MTNELPEVGSRWTIDGVEEEVDAVKKKGRGYYVRTLGEVVVDSPEGDFRLLNRYRLQDFRKKAKAVE